MNKPSIPKGTRDFSTVEMAKSNYLTRYVRYMHSTVINR